MAKDEFLQLAYKFDPMKHVAAGYYMSEKLDGFRAFWDGGVSRGLLSKDVPWSNTTSDHIHNKPIYATGLWTRYGNVIHAPEFWLEKLPNFPLDVELFIDRGEFQKLRSIASKYPDNRVDEDWNQIKMQVLDLPRMESLLAGRYINTTNFKKVIPDNAFNWWETRFEGPKSFKAYSTLTFRKSYAWLEQNLPQNDCVNLLKQEVIPETGTVDFLEERLNQITDLNGEGLIVRDPWGSWTAHRMKSVLKLKKLHDAEAKVVGFVSGKETDKGSKLLGLIGAYQVMFTNKDDEDIFFELSGFTNEEREFDSDNARTYAEEHPGEVMPAWVNSKFFPRGSHVTFRYRELTNDGVPKEARFYRKAGTR